MLSLFLSIFFWVIIESLLYFIGSSKSHSSSLLFEYQNQIEGASKGSKGYMPQVQIKIIIALLLLHVDIILGLLIYSISPCFIDLYLLSLYILAVFLSRIEWTFLK